VGGKATPVKVLAATPLMSELIQAEPVAAAMGATLTAGPDSSWVLALGDKKLVVLPGNARAKLRRSGIVCTPEAHCGPELVDWVALGRPAVALDGDLYLPAVG